MRVAKWYNSYHFALPPGLAVASHLRSGAQVNRYSTKLKKPANADFLSLVGDEGLEPPTLSV